MTSSTAPAPQAADPAPAAPRPAARSLSTRHMLLLLAGITLLAAFLRYWRLGFQSYWTDEGYTLVKIRGTFAEMLDSLTDQGFPPGWYALLRGWCLWLEKLTHNGPWAFAPVATRALPAIFGTLTVPAMYFLGRQFTDRKGALLVAFLAAINPFLIYYSRDIKMYAALWFFCTLNMAIFFRWQTSHRHWLWFVLYAATGICMTAIQSVAWFLIGLQFVFMLTKPRVKSMDAPLWLTGVALMSAFPLYWFYEYVEPAKWIARISGEVNAGTAWYTDYTDMTWKTGISLPTSHLLGYLWPVFPPNQKIIDWFILGDDFKAHLATRSLPWLARWEWYVALALFAIMLLGLFPWRGRRWRLNPERSAASTSGRWWWIALWLLLPSVILAATWIPKESDFYWRIWGNMDVKPIWEPRYLGILVPAWILWLAASLRRLPTLPVRIIALVFVSAVSLASALTNHLIYRNAPYQRAADIAEQFVDPHDRRSEAVAVPTSYYPAPAVNAAFSVARGLRPGVPEEVSIVALNENRTAPRGRATALWDALSNPRDVRETSPQYVRLFLATAIAQPRVKTIVLTDPYGDLVKPGDDFSDAALERVMGPRWKLVHEESYPLYYEWRYYIFHIWRTRVWQLQEPPPASEPAATR